jgi:hypothetical protein
MGPHPNTEHTYTETRRQEFVAIVPRERLADAAPDRSSRVPGLPPLWGLVTRAVRMIRSGLSVQPRPRVWTHA